jgi:hypothetical protein
MYLDRATFQNQAVFSKISGIYSKSVGDLIAL